MFKFKSKEVDPLLPQNEPSPEIQGYGTTTANKSTSEISYGRPPADQHYSHDHQLNSHEEEEYTTKSPPTPPLPPPSSQSDPVDDATRASGWATVGTFVTFFVFCCLVFLALKPNDDDNGIPKHGDLHPVPVPPKPHPKPELTLDERVTNILTQTPLIDGHNDLAITIRQFYKNDIHSAEFKNKWENGGLKGNEDLARLRKGMAGGAFWSSFVLCPNNASEDFWDAEYSTAVAHTLQQIDLIKRLQRMYPNAFSPAGTSVADMLAKFRASHIMFGAVSIEGLHQIPQSAAFSTLRLFYEVGVRAASLTWNCHNAFADAAMIWHKDQKTKVSGRHRGGLTEAGRMLITEMNRLGMLVDLSHTSYWTQNATLSDGTSKSPVIFSHSSVYSICPHPRNVKDDILDLVKKTNSVVMVNFSPDFISCVASDEDLPTFYPQNSTLHQAARHIVYIGDRIGYDHVGIGSDFDGVFGDLPKGLEGVDKFPDLVKELLKMGVSDENASKIVGGNVLKVWQTAEQVARNMQREGVREGEDNALPEFNG